MNSLSVQVILLLITTLQAQQVPLYLAIISQSPTTKSQVYSHISNSLQILMRELPQERATIMQDYIQLFSSPNPKIPWQNPDSWHITVYYLGYDPKAEQSPYYQNFKENQLIDIETFSIFYIPGKLICGPVIRPSNESVEISNNVAHLTMMVGSWQAVDSNYLLETMVFREGAPLKQEFDSGKKEGKLFQGQGFIIQKFSNIYVKEKGETVDVYVAKADLNLKLVGTTKIMY